MVLTKDKIRVFENGLQRMLSDDIDLSARSCVREGLVMNASDITRIPARRDLLLKYSRQQEQKRKKSSDRVKIRELENELKVAKQTIKTLAENNEILTASHRAMLLVVGEYGGIKAWQECFKKYDQALTVLRQQVKTTYSQKHKDPQ